MAEFQASRCEVPIRRGGLSGAARARGRGGAVIQLGAAVQPDTISGRRNGPVTITSPSASFSWAPVQRIRKR
jgi:hypothetical protein